MRRRLLLTIALAALATAFAPAPFPRERRQPAPFPLEGLWKGQSFHIKISAAQVIYRHGDSSPILCELRVDRAANPPTYDLAEGGRDWCGIYKLEGDTLTLCYNQGKGNRPTAFKSNTGGPGGITEVYQRVR